MAVDGPVCECGSGEHVKWGDQGKVCYVARSSWSLCCFLYYATCAVRGMKERASRVPFRGDIVGQGNSVRIEVAFVLCVSADDTDM